MAGTLKNKATNTQNMRIIEFIREHGSITPIDALNNIGCLRLSARIHDLKDMGYRFKTVSETVKFADGRSKTFARYFLEEVSE